MNKKILLILIIGLFLISACEQPTHEIIDRHSILPSDIEKGTPENDRNPPVLHSDEFEAPVPLAVINTLGAEDSPFFPADRDEFYFFFTPDVRVAVQEQVADGVTGIWMSKLVDGNFQEPERVFLQKPSKLAGDGCEFVQGDYMLFCTVREGYTGIHWFKAEWKDNEWTNWEEEFLPEGVGELHIWEDELYYHYEDDIYMREKVDDEWVNPTKIEAVSTDDFEGYPYITPNGNEMWFNRVYLGTPGTFRSIRENGEWQEPELIVSMFAGEPTLDQEGNLYFVHHFYDTGVMLEADIYVAYKK